MKLYSTTTCGPCQTVKKAIEDAGVEVDMVHDPIRFPDSIRSVPTLELNDGSYLTGAPFILKYIREVSDADL